MPRRRVEADSRLVQLLEMMVSLELHSLGASQDQIAKAIGKSKSDVNKVLKGVPKGRRRSDGS